VTDEPPSPAAAGVAATNESWRQGELLDRFWVAAPMGRVGGHRGGRGGGDDDEDDEGRKGVDVALLLPQWMPAELRVTLFSPLFALQRHRKQRRGAAAAGAKPAAGGAAGVGEEAGAEEQGERSAGGGGRKREAAAEPAGSDDEGGEGEARGRPRRREEEAEAGGTAGWPEDGQLQPDLDEMLWGQPEELAARAAARGPAAAGVDAFELLEGTERLDSSDAAAAAAAAAATGLQASELRAAVLAAQEKAGGAAVDLTGLLLPPVGGEGAGRGRERGGRLAAARLFAVALAAQAQGRVRLQQDAAYGPVRVAAVGG